MSEKGYLISSGYIGFIENNERQEFETENAYLEYIREAE